MNLLENKGVPVDKQTFTWRDIVGTPISKLDDEAFTRIRIILAAALELDALRLSHVGGRLDAELRRPLAAIRRIEQHQAATARALMSPDHSALEVTVAYEQAAIEITASIAQRETDPYLAQVYRFGLVEDVDHLYRFAALIDRLEGKDANNILQGHTDIVPGRPTARGHRAPSDALRLPYGSEAELASKLHATLLSAACCQALEYYLTTGPTFADPLARQLYAEIASIEEQHATEYGSLFDPTQSFLTLWLLHEATEVYFYYSCACSENNRRIRALWERFCDYELGQLHHVCELYRRHEGRDPAELLGAALPPLVFASQRDFVRDVLAAEVDLCANGVDFVRTGRDSPASAAYQQTVNAQGSPSTLVAAAYHWTSGTELNRSLRRVA